MTRFLAQALDQPRLAFFNQLKALEAANFHPNADIKLSIEINNKTRHKYLELGLDPQDTKPEELYHALIVKLASDDAILTRKLRTIAASKVSLEADPVAGMAEALKELPGSKACFALKTAQLKIILKAMQPKKTMRLTGYRSIDSMLKRENPIDVLAVAWLSESLSWKKRYLNEYKRLSSRDFEERSIKIIYANNKIYRNLKKTIASKAQHNILSLKELGALVLFPMPEDAPNGALTASLSLAIKELNDIKATSSYLKLAQLDHNYGDKLKEVSLYQPELPVSLFGQKVPWNLIQSYFTRSKNTLDSALIEPFVIAEDLREHLLDEALLYIEPKLAFWQGNESLGLVSNSSPVSLNIIDNAINVCNKRPYEKRIAHYFKQSLFSELLLRYLNRDLISASLLTGPNSQLAYQEA